MASSKPSEFLLQLSPGWPSGEREPYVCQRCADIDFDISPPNWPRDSRIGAVRLGTASEILLDRYCSICQLLSRNFKQYRFRHKDLIYFLCPFHTRRIQGHVPAYNNRLQEVSDTTSFVIVAEDSRDQFETGHDYSMQITIQAYGWISPVSSFADESKYSTRTLNEFVDFGILKSWLDTCDSDHLETCRFVDTRKMLPIKVIDCVNRTIVIADPSWDYVALSYVWGEALLSDIEAHFVIDDINLPSEVPNVIEDAIIATRRIGLQYLWVDRYCIAQSNVEEKDSQIQQMDLIYSRAWCTVIAAAGCDPTAGLPGVATVLRESSYLARVRDRVFISVPPDPVLSIQSSVWNRRGWTFQEAILSRRCIIFTSDQIYLQCGGMTCGDRTTLPLLALYRENLSKFPSWNEIWNDSSKRNSHNVQLFRPITKVRYPYHECSSLIKSYTNRMMSKPDDILNGMFGIFRRFESIHQQFRQFYGIIVVPDVICMQSDAGEGDHRQQPKMVRLSSYTEQLATGLCWDVDRISNFKSGRRNYGFPSWSWIGWIERLIAPSEFEGYVSNTHELKFWVDNQYGTINWESYCHANLQGQNLSIAKTVFRVEATFVKVTLRRCTYDPAEVKQRPLGEDLYWQAVLEREDKTCLSTHFSLTRELDERIPSSYEKLKSQEWPAFILGVRHGTCYSGSVRVHSPNNSRLVLMVVDGIIGVVERLGIALFEGRNALTDWNAELQGVATERRRIMWG